MKKTKYLLIFHETEFSLNAGIIISEQNDAPILPSSCERK